MPQENSGIPDATENVAVPSDDPIERQINIALEAQDGKPEVQDTETKTGSEERKSGTETPAPNDGKDSKRDGGDNPSQPKPPKEGKKEQEQAHSPKDLKLPDGTVVKGGAERRFYEQRETARQQAQHFQRELTTEKQAREKAEGELRTLRETSQQLNGVDPQTLRIGTQIVQDLQRDPVGTMKKLLAEVISQGHTIEGIGSGVDQLAIQRMIDARLPTQDTTAPTEQQILADAQTEVDNFYRSYPDARPHDALLGRMLRDNPGVDLNTAYFELKNAFADKGFDFSRTLDDNLKDAAPNNVPQSDNKQQPLPNGRPATPNARPADEVKIAHEDTDMSDIVRAAMRESGLNV